MPKIQRNGYVGWKKEGTRNTVEATASTVYLPFTDFDPVLKNEYYKDESAFNKRQSLLGQAISGQSVEGKMGGLADPDYVGYLLMGLYGSCTSVQDGTTGAYEHTFAVLQNTELPTHTLQYERSDEGIYQSRGVQVDGMEFDFSSKEVGKYSADLKGLEEAAGTSQTVAYAKPTRVLQGKNVTAKYATTVSGLSSGTAFNISNVKVSPKNNLEYDWVLGSLSPADLYAKNFEAEISFTGLVSSTAFYTIFKAGTKTAFDITALGTTLLGTSTTHYPMINFTVAPSVVDISWSQSLNDLVKFDAKISCEWSATDGFNLRAKIRNAIASY
jgi:hypothetical protein